MENELIEANRGLVKSIVTNNFNIKNSTEFEELEQAGLIGLMKAMRKYDAAKGLFSTYAHYYILGEINDFIRREKYVHINRNCVPIERKQALLPVDIIVIDDYLDDLSEDERIIIDLRLENYTFAEIADKLECSTTHVHNIYQNVIDRIKAGNE